jgi:vacuolar-type H+-ATPase subunit I/STV1
MGRPDRRKKSSGNAPVSGGSIRDDIRALNSSILLITQKIKYVVRNEKILGRNLIVLNKKLKRLEEKVVSPQNISGSGANSEEVEDLRKKIDLLGAQLSDLQQRMVSKEDLKELKYIIDSINPLEFVTIKQVKDLIDKNKKE